MKDENGMDRMKRKGRKRDKEKERQQN